jgi:hypothetical protein
MRGKASFGARGDPNQMGLDNWQAAMIDPAARLIYDSPGPPKVSLCPGAMQIIESSDKHGPEYSVVPAGADQFDLYLIDFSHL